MKNRVRQVRQVRVGEAFSQHFILFKSFISTRAKNEKMPHPASPSP